MMDKEEDDKSDFEQKALEYSQIGLNAVSVKGKKPLIPWKELQHRKQTDQDFRSLPWSEADGFALVGGSQATGGYLCAIDLDAKNVSAEAAELGVKILGKLPTTRTDKTPSGGRHLVYLSRTRPKTSNAYRDRCGIEILGCNKLIVMAPSKDYETIIESPLTVVDSIRSVLRNAMKKAGVSKTINGGKEKAGRTESDPSCILKLMEGVEKGKRNEVAIRLASYCLNTKKRSHDETTERLRSWNSRNLPPLPEEEIISAVESAAKKGYVYGCEDPILKEQCDDEGACRIGRKKAKEEVIHVAFIELPDGLLAEQAFDGNQTYFLIYDPKTGTISRLY